MKEDTKFYIGLVLVICLWLFAIKQAPAVEMVIGIGQTQFTPSDAGIWWQRGLPHHLETNSRSLELGFTDHLTDSIRWNASYMYLGEVNTWAVATTDEDYTGGGCRANPCAASNLFMVRGEEEGFKFSVAPEWNIGNNIKAFAEAGAWVFIARVHITVVSNVGTQLQKVFEKNRDELWHIKPFVGTGLEWKKWQLNLSAYAVDPGREDGDTVPNFTGYAYNLSIRKIFE